MRLSLLSYERVECVGELAGGHLVPVTPGRKLPQKPSTTLNKWIERDARRVSCCYSSSTMEATFERMIAQAVRGNQAAGPPQEPTVPDKCVLSCGYTLKLVTTRVS